MKAYHFLEPDDIIQKGDERLTGILGTIYWEAFASDSPAIGERTGDRLVRRPIPPPPPPDRLVREHSKPLRVTSLPEQRLDWDTIAIFVMIGGTTLLVLALMILLAYLTTHNPCN